MDIYGITSPLGNDDYREMREYVWGGIGGEKIHYTYKKPSNRPGTAFFKAIEQSSVDWKYSLDSQGAHLTGRNTPAIQVREQFCEAVGLQKNDIICGVMMPEGYLRLFIKRWLRICNLYLPAGHGKMSERGLTQVSPWYLPLPKRFWTKYGIGEGTSVLIRYDSRPFVDVFPECMAIEIVKSL